MGLTPVEVRHIRLGRAPVGYRRSAVESAIEEIASSFEVVWRERADLADRVEQLEADLVRYRELESLLRTTLVSAERTSAELKEQARREADLIVAQAHEEARAVTHRAIAERERLNAEAERIRALLRGALTVVEAEERPAAAA
jgi:cell division initiation protein